jgi:hypothetical protein
MGPQVFFFFLSVLVGLSRAVVYYKFPLLLGCPFLCPLPRGKSFHWDIILFLFYLYLLAFLCCLLLSFKFGAYNAKRKLTTTSFLAPEVPSCSIFSPSFRISYTNFICNV